VLDVSAFEVGAVIRENRQISSRQIDDALALLKSASPNDLTADRLEFSG
jgi:hypothetical protein